MSDNKDNTKKGFFSRLFGGSSSSEESKTEVVSTEESAELPSLSVLNKMKKADIVSAAKDNDLDLDINLTKAKLLEAWEVHFNPQSSPSAVDDAADVMAEVAAKAAPAEEEVQVEETPAEEAPVEEEAPAEEAPEEEAPAEEAPVEEEAPAEDAPSEEAPVEETPAEEEAPVEEAPLEETPAEEEAPVEETPAEETPAEEEAPVEETPAEEEAPAEAKISLDEKSPAQIINDFESKQMKTDLPDFRPGDTVIVSVKVKEGDRTRLQAFEGVVMGLKNAGLNSSFIVRKISSGIGVERTFQTHSPMIDSIKVKRKGDVRQSKLFYLRERSGKSARIKERLE